MSRASDGTYTLAVAADKVPLEVLTSSDWNSIFSDLETAMTDSLSRSGDGAMLDQLQLLAADTKTAPGLTWAGDLTTGYYHAGAGDLGISIADTDLVRMSAALVAITGALTISSTLDVTGNATLAGALVMQSAGSSDINFVRDDTSVVDGDVLGELRFLSEDPSSGALGVRISARSTGTWDTNDFPSGLRFGLDNLGNMTEYMVLTNNLLTITGTISASAIKTGATQGASGAAANEFWATASHATLPDNVLLIGV